MKPTNQQINSILSQLQDLTCCHAIWWELVHDTPQNAEGWALDHYMFFFTPTARMLQEGIVIIIARLFDRGEDVCSFEKLIRRLEKSEPEQARELRAKIDKKSTVIKRVQKLRNKAHAHRDLKIEVEELCKKFPVNMPEIEGLLLLCSELAGCLSELAGRYRKEEVLEQVENWRGQAAEQTRLLLAKLSENDSESSTT